MVPCLDLRHKVTRSEIHLLINIDVPNMTCQIGDEYKLFLIIQRIIEQHKFTVVYVCQLCCDQLLYTRCQLPKQHTEVICDEQFACHRICASVAMKAAELFFFVVLVFFVLLTVCRAFFASSSDGNVELAM